MANWPQGKVIVGSPATDMEARRNNPFGFLRKVKSTRVEGSSVIVETENASLDEAITGQYRKETDLGALPALELPEGTDLSAYDVPVRLGRGQPFPEGQDSDAGVATNQQPLNDPAHDGPTVFGKQVQPLNITNQAFEVSAPNLTLLDVTRPVRIPNAPGEPLDVSARIVVSPAVRFQPRIVIDYDSQLLPYPALNSFEFLVGGNLNVSSSLEVQVAARRPAGMTVQQQTAILAWLRVNALQYTFEKEIGRPRVVPFNLGPVPMVSTTKAFLQCEAKLSGAAHVKGSLAQNVNLTFGVKWRRGNGWATDFSYPNQTPAVTGQVISGEAEVELDCGIILRTDAYAGGVAGPYAQARADVVGTAAVKEECPAPADERSARNHPADVKVDLGIKAYAALQVGVDSINFLKLLTLEYGPYDIVRKNWNEGSQVMVPNPLYVPGCGAAWCSTPEVPAREHLPIRSWTFTKPNGGLGSPDAGVWCVVPCDDGRKNGMEADVDCGGAGVCARCTRDQACTTGADCLSGVCGGNGRCVASLCEDGVKGQQETDVDCGGPTCPACQVLTEPGPQCAADSDCAGSFCSNDGVAPKRCTRDLCRDGRVTGTESDVDCGASEGCQGCSVGKRCTGPSDCASGACHATTGLCVANTCVDGARTGDESDVDCGGSCPTKCALNQQCNFTQRGNADCASNVCSTPPFSGAPGRCVATTCENLRGDADEIGVDCSGACAAKCPVGQTCRFGQNDCVTAAVCSATTRRCEPPGCGDGVLNGQESSIDCGGPTCLKCALSKACNANSDCTSSVCSGGRCVGSVCENGVKDSTEADVDCGGSCTLACATGSTCSQPRDCASNLCVSGRCISDACQDRVRNGAEADVDCGGATCTARCAGGKRCLVNGDCQSNLCNTTAQRCVAGPCDDGLLTAGSESDVDCGGSCGAMNPAKRCTVNQRCTAAADCASGVCNATTQRCVSDACFDGVRNGTETDLDCGGSCDPKCAAGRLCTVATDCQSGSCTAMGRCATDQCSDGRVNGNETGLDCGGQCATRCPVGQGCLTGADCAHPMGLQGVNGFCSTATATCTNSSCTTGVKDGDETGVDCGGSCAARCPVGQGCTTNADCAGNLCNTTTRLCVASRCENGLKDQDETDIDCGGDTCNGCNVGQACTLGRHCATQYCGTTNLCIPSVPRTCSDAFVRTASATSGMYLIDPDGPQTRFSTGGWRQPMSTYCLMQNDPNGILTGGWTPVMYANSFWSTSEPRLYGYFRNSQDVSNREACSTSNPTCSFSTAGNTCQNDVGGGPCTNANTGCHCTSAAPWSVQYAPSLHGNPVNFSGSSVAVEDALAFNLAVNGGVGQYQVTDGIPATHFRWQVFRGGALIFDSGIFSMAPPVLPGTPLPWFANGQWGLNSFFGGSPWDYCAQTTSLAAESYPSGQSGLVGLPFNNDPVGYAARDGWCRRFGRNMSRSIGQPFSSLPADVTLGWVHRLLPRGVNGQTTSQTAPWVGLWLGNYGHAPGSPRNWVPDVANSANGAQPPPQNNTLGICNGLVFGTDDTSRATECTAYAHVTGTSFSYGAGETTDITKGSQFSAGVPGLVFVLWAR
ncbi:MAG: hypothetical protein GQE15_38175, partial [Archangiaceae bacterium]|nr:hypothetical protein [Archangiaceae bacterium]